MSQTTPAIPKGDVPAIGQTDDKPRLSAGRMAESLIYQYPMVIGLAILLIVTSIIYPGFWDVNNLQNLLQQNVGLMLCSVGMTFVILAGGFDLSVGSVYAAGAMFYIHFLGKTPAPIGVLLAILLGVLFGAVNGGIINVLRVNPFVATLGTSSIFIGVITIYTGATASFATDQSYLWLGNTKVAGIPIDGLFGLIIMLISAVILWRSTFGRSIYALGGNREAARLSGIRVGWISALTFILIGAMAAFGGVCAASQLGTATPNFVGNVTLEAIAVVIIGGTALTGGEGAMWRSLVGLAILAVITNLFTAKNLSPNLQTVFEGVIVIIAVCMDVWIRHRRAS